MAPLASQHINEFDIEDNSLNNALDQRHVGDSGVGIPLLFKRYFKILTFSCSFDKAMQPIFHLVICLPLYNSFRLFNCCQKMLVQNIFQSKT